MHFCFPSLSENRIRTFILCLATPLKLTFEGNPFLSFLHAFYSLLIQQKANSKYIQEQLGHGSIKTTMDLGKILFQGDHQHFVCCLHSPTLTLLAYK
jgi:site-specific recombinase XerD